MQTTDSGIMPYKKSGCLRIDQGEEQPDTGHLNELSLLIGNLSSGYHRDMRLSMEILFPAIEELKACLQMTALMFTKIRISKDILKEDNTNTSLVWKR